MTNQDFHKKEQVETLLKNLGLKVENFSQKYQEFVEKDKRFFYSSCFTKKNLKLFIKIAIKDSQFVFNSLAREALAIKAIGNITEVKIPKYCDGNFDAPLAWFIDEYVEGEPLGYFYELNKKYNQTKFIDQLLSNLIVFYKSSDRLFAQNRFFKNLKKNDYQVYLKTFSSFKRYAQRKNIRLNFAAMFDLLEKVKPFFMDEENYVIAQGDFTLANNIVSDDGIYLIDWESIHIDNFADDLGRIWIQTWLYPDWRRKLLSRFMNRIDSDRREKFKEIFRVVAINQAFSEIGGGSKLCEKRFSQGVIDASLITISNALKGFDFLI